MRGKITLKVTAGPLRDLTFNFEDHETFIFGRAKDCHARLAKDDITASRHHFILEVNPPDVRLRDLGSLNKTLVNGIGYGGREFWESPDEAVKRNYPTVDLHDGDEIRVGETIFKVIMQAYCRDCGLEIPDSFKPLCKISDFLYLCGSCRNKGDSEDANTVLTRARSCELCGKDVSGEMGARPGVYTCEACRTKGAANLASMLERYVHKSDAPTEMVGAGITMYDVGKKIGEGAMGEVFVARRKSDGMQAAVKVMLAKVAVDEYSRQMFLREIKEMDRLDHPNIVKMLSYGSYGSSFYFVMEYCQGGSLSDLYKRRGPLNLTEATPIFSQALEGLAAAHQLGTVHRDLKPPNILMTESHGGIVKIADFGLAKNFEKSGLSGFTVTGAAGGTPEFMPREQYTNYKYVKPSTDVFSIGATFYYLLTGKFVRDFSSKEDRISVVLNKDVIPIQNRGVSIPPQTAKVINRSISDDAGERYSSSVEMLQELRDALQQEAETLL
jgi:serine/threonine-protein kinase